MSLPLLNTAPARASDNAVKSLLEERAAESAARTLALPDAQSVEDLTALLTSAGERGGRDSYRSRTA
jgi:hypothetical protein